MSTEQCALVAPRININGTSRNELLRQYLEAFEATRVALATARQAWPHARDYQTCEGDEYKTARSQHERRIAMLERVLSEYDELALAVQDATS